MNQARADLWSVQADATVITTNGIINARGECVMGRGVARDARDRFRPAHSTSLAVLLGSLIKGEGNHVHDMGHWDSEHTDFHIVTFPVKRHWRDQADPDLISRSCEELLLMADRMSWSTIAMVRPGCGNGGLRWQEIEPLCEAWLDDRFTVYEK